MAASRIGRQDEREDTTRRALRLSDIAKEPLEMLMPISGYEDMPIVSLEMAVKPLLPFLPAVQIYANTAKHRCKNPPPDGLTIDESASIMLYSMSWEPLGKCLYVALNATLRSTDRDKLKPWYLYLKLFLTALHRLPSTPKSVYRGVKIDLHADYPKGKTIVWWGFSSCTVSIEILQSEVFLGMTDPRTLFTIESNSGKNIQKHSYFPSEDEILLLAATEFKVCGCLNQGNGLHLIQLQETQPSSSLLHSLLLPTNLNKSFSVPLRGSSTYIPPNAQWNNNGYTIAGQNSSLSYPRGLYVDDDQTVYVVDHLNNRIVTCKSGEMNGRVVAGGHGQGNGAHQLSLPTDVIVDKEKDCLIICDAGNKRVVRWSRQNGKNGETIISNTTCWSLTMDENRLLYVTDVAKHEVIRYRMDDSQGTVVAGGNGKGNRLDQLDGLYYIFVDQEHSVFVSDFYNHRVMKWKDGAKEGIVVAGGQGYGNSMTQLNYPNGVLVDQLNNVYVADGRNNRIMRWPKEATQGNIIVGGNGEGAQPNQLSCPLGLSFDRHGNLYVVDSGNKRVQRFTIEMSSN